MADEILRGMLMYFIVPIWLAAGFTDYLCHRAAHIEETSGWKESILHLLQLVEMGLAVLCALLLEINSGVLAIMIACLVLHELTTIWDVRYASRARVIAPVEQHVHSLMETIPLMGLLFMIALHWQSFIGLFGLAPARFDLVWKQTSLSWTYIAAVLAGALVFEVAPFVEELLRGIRQSRYAPDPGGEAVQHRREEL